MVILGAGASFDSIDKTTLEFAQWESLYRPPLSDDLFGPRPSFGEALRRYPAVLPLVARIRRVVRAATPLESALSRLRDESETYTKRFPQLLAMQFYLRDIIARCTSEWSRGAYGVTYYQELVDRIEQWRTSKSERVCYVTFNYDTLLEDAIDSVHRIQLNDFDRYLNDYCGVVKPHGSVNWHRQANASPSELETGWSKIVFERGVFGPRSNGSALRTLRTANCLYWRSRSTAKPTLRAHTNTSRIFEARSGKPTGS